MGGKNSYLESDISSLPPPSPSPICAAAFFDAPLPLPVDGLVMGFSFFALYLCVLCVLFMCMVCDNWEVEGLGDFPHHPPSNDGIRTVRTWEEAEQKRAVQ